MRKAPVQARSRQMVDSLLEATARTVAERGLAETTTNHIAARAGVSVGSLYQYFAGKEALLDALSDKLSGDLGQLLQQHLQEKLDAEVTVVLRDLLGAVFDFFEADSGLYLELLRHWHHPRTERAINLLVQQLLEISRLYFVRHHEEFRFENLPAALFITFNSAVFTGVRYLSRPPSYLSRDDVLDGLVAMLAGYLQKDEPAAAGKGRRRK
jgi:AcrR family transcriptional regulator